MAPDRIDDCRFLRESFELYLDGEVRGADLVRLSVHLRGCGACATWIAEDAAAADALLIGMGLEDAALDAADLPRAAVTGPARQSPARQWGAPLLLGTALILAVVSTSIGLEEKHRDPSRERGKEVALIADAGPAIRTTPSRSPATAAVSEFLTEVDPGGDAEFGQEGFRPYEGFRSGELDADAGAGRLIEGARSRPAAFQRPGTLIDEELHVWLDRARADPDRALSARKLAEDLRDHAPVLVQMVEGLLDADAGEDAPARVELIRLLEVIAHPDVVLVLVRATGDAEPQVRGAALESLDRLAGPAAAAHFLARARIDEEPTLRIFAAAAAARRGDDEAATELVKFYYDAGYRVWRERLVREIGALDPQLPAVRPFLRCVIRYWSAERGLEVLAAALEGLLRQDDADSLDLVRDLMRRLDDADPAMNLLQGAARRLEPR